MFFQLFKAQHNKNKLLSGSEAHGKHAHAHTHKHTPYLHTHTSETKVTKCDIL